MLLAIHFSKSIDTLAANYRFGSVKLPYRYDDVRIQVSDDVFITFPMHGSVVYKPGWIVEKIELQIRGRIVVIEAFHPDSQYGVTRTDRIAQMVKVALSITYNPIHK